MCLGYSVSTVAATDPDASTYIHGNLIYSILSGNGDGYFQINPETAEVTLAKTLDMETITSSTFNLVIKVKKHRNIKIN